MIFSQNSGKLINQPMILVNFTDDGYCVCENFTRLLIFLWVELMKPPYCRPLIRPNEHGGYYDTNTRERRACCTCQPTGGNER